MVSNKVNIITGIIALALIATFTLGLAHSIIIGFAGFEGGLPFLVIVSFVLILALYDFWDSTLRKKKSD